MSNVECSFIEQWKVELKVEVFKATFAVTRGKYSV
jgi:hypothetical protein